MKSPRVGKRRRSINVSPLPRAPHLARNLDHPGKLALDRVEEELARADVAGKPALWAAAELIEVDRTARVVNPPLAPRHVCSTTAMVSGRAQRYTRGDWDPYMFSTRP